MPHANDMPTVAPLSAHDLPYVIAALAHELRGPLNAMAGWSQVVAQSLQRGQPVPEKALDGIFRAISEQTNQLDAMSAVAWGEVAEPVTAGRPMAIDFSRCLREAVAPIDEKGDALLGLDELPTISWRHRAHLQPLAATLITHLRTLRTRLALTRVARRGQAPGLRIRGLDAARAPAGLQALVEGAPLRELRERPRELLACWRLRGAMAEAGLRALRDDDLGIIVAPYRA